ncbi:MAG: hypothetical protein ACI91K_000001 [Flavobacteriales bacterium]
MAASCKKTTLFLASGYRLRVRSKHNDKPLLVRPWVRV